MSKLTANGQTLAEIHLTMSHYGAWVADVLVKGTALESSVTLVVGDLSLKGTVVQGGEFTGDLRARIVAGGGGWGKTIPAKGYAHAAGVKASTVLNDAARACGETIVIDKDRTLGLNWARESATAERTLALVVGDEWWIDPDGVTQTRVRDRLQVVAPFTLISRDGSRDQFEIATESFAGWIPGRTFSCPTVPEIQTISSVTITADNEGKVRLTVLGSSPIQERLRSSIRSIIRAEIAALSYGFTYDYTVAVSVGMPGTDPKIDATPIAGSPMPPLTKVPLAVGLGVVSPPLVGTRCRIRFVDADPSRPEVVALGATTEHVATIEATALLIYNFMSSLMAAAGGGPLVAAVLQPLLGTAMTAALGAQAAPAPPGLAPQLAAAAAAQSGFALGVTPSPAMFAAWTAVINGLAAKTLNVSGAFPSVGIPNG